MSENQENEWENPTMRGRAEMECRTMRGRPEEPERRLRVGETLLNRYTILDELGQGGMGVVYQCFDTVGGIEVALKALPPEICHNRDEMEEVRENFALVSRLIHQNISALKTLERDAETGAYYLVMEYVVGDSLRRWIRTVRRGGEVTLEMVLPVLRQIALALDYAHNKKILHRDIKPGNIIVEPDGTVKVLDFGLAAEIRSSLSRVSMAPQDTSGTKPYMAPEQWRGKRQHEATDQYALAVLIYEILAGHLPFEGTEDAALLYAVLNEEPDAIDGLSPSAWAALRKALSKESKNRFPTCVAFMEALSGGHATMEPSTVDVKRGEPSTPVSPPDPEAGTIQTFDLGGGVKLEMAYCPAGSFQMGSPENEVGRQRGEIQHRVTLTKGFWIGKYPITQSQWEAVMGNNPSYFKGENLPVEKIRWNDCQEFIQKLNVKIGQTFSLPTEAQWEYACRAGSTGVYAGTGNLDGMGWYSLNSWKSHPVGQKNSNTWGLYDMHGSVWEWCQDWYGDYLSNSVTDPVGPSTGSYRVIRGGGWASSAHACRVASRDGFEPDFRYGNLGFRLVCVPAS